MNAKHLLILSAMAIVCLATTRPGYVHYLGDDVTTVGVKI